MTRHVRLAAGLLTTLVLVGVLVGCADVQPQVDPEAEVLARRSVDTVAGRVFDALDLDMTTATKTTAVCTDRPQGDSVTGVQANVFLTLDTHDFEGMQPLLDELPENLGDPEHTDESFDDPGHVVRELRLETVRDGVEVDVTVISRSDATFYVSVRSRCA